MLIHIIIRKRVKLLTFRNSFLRHFIVNYTTGSPFQSPGCVWNHTPYKHNRNWMNEDANDPLSPPVPSIMWVVIPVAMVTSTKTVLWWEYHSLHLVPVAWLDQLGFWLTNSTIYSTYTPWECLHIKKGYFYFSGILYFTRLNCYLLYHMIIWSPRSFPEPRVQWDHTHTKQYSTMMIIHVWTMY